MNSILIKDTTRAEREKLINRAIAISMLDCKAPVKKDMELYKKYINGELELKEVKQKLINKYKEN
ncbi:hypothetical protein DWV12_16900 [Clostridium botulinum]|uniref:hypothetical protein n=1 Tax=Clostridium botulinum TaxID=1491 RepID=UPI00217D8F5C|nr:hypothetical protein [Clostridium botulinum]MCS6105525.1 hypothetical protein [Clostridium botulinum]MCS6108984.1 hypothetical protein [Clostridium botulinum]